MKIFFQQLQCDTHNQRPFFVYKMKIPKKWQIPLVCYYYIQTENKLYLNKGAPISKLWFLFLDYCQIRSVKVIIKRNRLKSLALQFGADLRHSRFNKLIRKLESG